MMTFSLRLRIWWRRSIASTLQCVLIGDSLVLFFPFYDLFCSCACAVSAVELFLTCLSILASVRRERRIKRAFDLSAKKKTLPKELHSEDVLEVIQIDSILPSVWLLLLLLFQTLTAPFISIFMASCVLRDLFPLPCSHISGTIHELRSLSVKSEKSWTVEVISFQSIMI